MDYSKFRENLTNLIEQRYGSKAAFSDLTGIPRPSMSRYCTADKKPELENVVKMATTAGVSVDWLLGLTDIQPLDAESREFYELFSVADERDREIVKAILNKYRKG